MSLILNPLRFVIQQLSPLKLSYLPLERKLVLIYWIMRILKSLISLIQPQIQQLVVNFQHRLKNVWIIAINVEETITAQGALGEINFHQTPRVKYKVKISLRRRESYHRTYI